MNTNQSNKKYPQKKQLLYQELQDLPSKYQVIALSKMNKVRATQLMTLRKKFHDQIKIKIIKNKIAQRAFERVKGISGIEDLSRELEGQCALMFTNISPFKLNLIFGENKVFLPAKGGDIAPKDITIPAGNTGIPPGPVLSEFKEAKVPTKIDQGSIAVTKDTIVVRTGEMISQKLSSLLSKVNIKPIEAGVVVNFAISDGLQYSEQDLQLDVKQYITELQKSYSSALNFAIEILYFAPETINSILALAHQKSLNVASTAGYISNDTAEIIIKKAQTHAHVLSDMLKTKGYESQK
ncbi:MAG TPA: 50S ribosomal protein L10 [Nitrososphaeraceae archaeon]|jgi:large subunit ribosomal protein L10|nr:50S ribosomal protein L10 [Nitrososphaeraceae archaeon]